MFQVKTFGEPLQPFKTRRELEELDARVNAFLEEQKVTRVVSIKDTPTTENGTVIGLVRLVVFEV
jgi:hypothetical protein